MFSCQFIIIRHLLRRESMSLIYVREISIFGGILQKNRQQTFSAFFMGQNWTSIYAAVIHSIYGTDRNVYKNFASLFGKAISELFKDTLLLFTSPHVGLLKNKKILRNRNIDVF